MTSMNRLQINSVACFLALFFVFEWCEISSLNDQLSHSVYAVQLMPPLKNDDLKGTLDVANKDRVPRLSVNEEVLQQAGEMNNSSSEIPPIILDGSSTSSTQTIWNASESNPMVETQTPTVAMTPKPTESPSTNAPTKGVPTNPTNVEAVAYDARVQVSWEAPADDGGDPIIEYSVATHNEETDTESVGYIIISSSDPRMNPSTFTIVDNLLNGVSYTFKVRAKNNMGYSTWSASSSPVSPLHPPDLCTHVSCSVNGACFPTYDEQSEAQSSALHRGARCVCKPGYKGLDCGARDDKVSASWKSSNWGSCSIGCGGGQRKRTVACVDIKSEKEVAEEMCSEPKPITTQICNEMACGVNVIDVDYTIDVSFSDTLFSIESETAFNEAFAHEFAAAVNIMASRVKPVSTTRGSIKVNFLLLPPSKDGEKSLDEVISSLQDGLSSAESRLRTQGTFVRKVVHKAGVRVAFLMATEVNVEGGVDISISGLIGTVFILVGFISSFAWFLRRRHEMILKAADERLRAHSVEAAKVVDLRPMNIQTLS